MKGCQLQLDLFNEDLVVDDSTEYEIKLQVSSSLTGTKSNNINGFIVTEPLLEKITDKENFRQALKRVIKNKGSHGVDGMNVDEIRDYLNMNWDTLKQLLMGSKYYPQPLRRVELPKRTGGTRRLWIPTIADRVTQMVARMYVEPVGEPMFCEDSYCYRLNKSAIDAIATARKRYWRYDYVIELDEKLLFYNIGH